MDVVLGPNQYGKAEVRLVHVDRSGPAHVINDLNVTCQLLGDFAAAFLTGDNSSVIATDTQKNTIYALARTGGVSTPEEFALRLARTFTDGYDYVSGARVEIEKYAWDRIDTPSGPHDHAFARGSGQVRTALVARDGDRETVFAGVTGMVVLKSTGSEFHGFPRVPYTSLPETTDRILATAVSARWRYAGPDPDTADWDGLFETVHTVLLEQFAGLHSLALQQTLFAMGREVLHRCPEIAEIRLSMPNKHHFLVDLAPFDLDNPNEVYFAADRPYGLIEASVLRAGAEVEESVWEAVTRFR